MKTLGQKIREYRRALGATQSALGKAVGVSHVTVSLWEKDETAPRGENLYKLAKIFGCNADELMENTGGVNDGDVEPNVIPLISRSTKLPVVSWVRAGAWTEVCDNGPVDEWRYTTARVSGSSFMLKVIGDSMTNPTGFPSIPEGSYVIVDPEVEAHSGNIVIAKLVDSNEATLKKLVIDGPNKYLMPLNPNYKPIPINGNCKIVGVVKKMEIDF